MRRNSGYNMLTRNLVQKALWSLVVIIAFGAAGLVASRARPADDVDLQSLAQQFCVVLPETVRVSPSDRVEVSLDVNVPSQAPMLNASTLRGTSVARGSVVQIVVESPIPGAAGVHGLSNIVPVRAGEKVRITFRAQFPGQFPIHFHGVDGSHFAVGELTVS